MCGRVQLYKIFDEYDQLAPADFPDRSPEDQLHIYITMFCKILYGDGKRDSDTNAILVEEFTKPSPFLEEMVDTFNRPRVERLLKIIKDLLGEGATDDMARDCLVSVSGQLLYYSFAKPVFFRLFPDYFAENTHEQWEAHVFKFAMGGEDVLTEIVACIRCCACIKNCPENARIFEDDVMKTITEWLNENCAVRKEPQLFGVEV
jgi:NAD-dependent dihydropyrimidine dehydrogenase PreA subunit